MDDTNCKGWICLHRKLLDSQVWAKPDLFMLWVYCLLRANHKTKWVSVDGITEPVLVGPGQFITGRFQLHKGLYPQKASNQHSPLTVWRWLEKLRSMGNLNMQTNNKYTMVTIVNWERYQTVASPNEQQNEQQLNNSRTTTEQQLNTNNNDNNADNGNNDKQKPSPPAAMPEIPNHLKAVWPEWVATRKEMRKPLTPRAVELQLKNLAKKDNATAIKIVEYSIMNNYQGLIFDRVDKPGRAGSHLGPTGPRQIYDEPVNPDDPLGDTGRRQKYDEPARPE